MATSTQQRVFIWVIAVVMMVGSLGAYFVMILANNNGAVSQTSDADMQRQLEEYQKQQEAAAAANAASSKPIDGFTAEPFDAASVTELQKEDLVIGEGAEAPEGRTISVSYFGWTPDGKLFDSTNKNGTNTIAEGFELKSGGLIEGWVAGIPGMKVGGVRKLVIPASQAYGEAGSPPNIAPNTPLSFIVRLESVEQ